MKTARSQPSHQDLVPSAPLSSVEDVNELPTPPRKCLHNLTKPKLITKLTKPATPLPPPGQDLVDRALQILGDIQKPPPFSDSYSTTSSADDIIGRVLTALVENVVGPLLPPEILSELPFASEKGKLNARSFENQVDDTWRFDHVDLEEVESIMEVGKGESVTMRIAKAARLLKIAGYDLGHAGAVMTLAEMNLFRKYGQARNTTTAFQHFRHLAHQHADPVAQRYMGLMYASGIGVKRDYAKALVYLNFAAMAHDLSAEQTLGYWYLSGIGVAKSCDDSVFFYRSVADQTINRFKAGPPGGLRVPPMKRRLADEDGGIYGPGASGPGHPHSSKSAMSPETMKEIFEVQAEEGDTHTQVHLGRAYYEGFSHIRSFPVTPDYRKALKYFKLAAKSYLGPKPSVGTEITHALKTRMAHAGIASGYLGMMHWRGDGVKQDNMTARKFFERGEELENGMSLAALGVMHLEGVAGFKKDPKKALEYFTEAAQRENAEAQVQLGEMNLRSSKPDAFTNAFKFYTAASSSHLMAVYRLGEMYSRGLGTPSNCLMGVGYLKSVTEKGDWHDDSIRLAEQSYYQGDYESALVYYLVAAERGAEIAQSNAAWMLDRGLVGAKGLERVFGRREVDPYDVGIVLWNRAANQGNVDGRVKVGDYYFNGWGVNAVGKRRNVTIGGESKQVLVDGSGEAKQIADLPAGDVKDEQTKENEMDEEKNAFDLGGVVRNITRWVMPVLPGARPGKPDYKMAALYYQVASDEFSALAQWNLGFMHENGLGVEKDYPLAKRMYDMSLATNPDAYLPVNLALFLLFLKSSIAIFSTLATDLITGRLHLRIFTTITSTLLTLLEAEFGPLLGDDAIHQDILPALMDEEEEGVGLGVGPGGYGRMVGRLVRAAEGVWFELVLVSGLAAIASVLFLWRQLISAAEEAQRRAARVEGVGAGPVGVPAPVPAVTPVPPAGPVAVPAAAPAAAPASVPETSSIPLADSGTGQTGNDEGLRVRNNAGAEDDARH
ncbi:ERAD-associated protein [Dinochytrium kinnereticum]|nr:ERAD-associated protein [Dinochytrium kinnereticum]